MCNGFEGLVGFFSSSSVDKEELLRSFSWDDVSS